MAFKWYIVHAYSNFENKVAEEIQELKDRDDLKDMIEEIKVPTEEVAQLRRGKKVMSKKRFFPGYILVKMDMNDRSHNAIRNLPRVTGFLGADNTPAPVPQKEIDYIMQQVQEGVDKPKPTISFEIGEQVRVADGPFASFNGVVEDVDEERSRLKVSVSIFGRSTPVDLEYTQVEKS
jgi:transcriptional antiterminator NusG